MTTALDQARSAPDGAEHDALDLEKVTELEAFGPDRMDGVNGPANGYPPLMLKSLGATDQADTQPAAPTQEGHITAVITEVASPDAAPPADTPPPADESVAKAGEPNPDSADSVTVELPADLSVSMSPRDLAKLTTFKQRLTVQQAAVTGAQPTATVTGNVTTAPQPTAAAAVGDVAKRDFDPNVGGGVDRDKIPTQDFADPEHRAFPIVKPSDVGDVAPNLNHGNLKGDPEEIKRRTIAIAHRKGPDFVAQLPKAWGDAGAKKSAEPDTSAETGTDTTGAAAMKAKGGKKKGKGGKPFPGAAPKFDGKDSDHDGVDADQPGSEQDDETRTPPKVKPGSARKGAKDCTNCGKTYHADSKQRTCENCGHDLPAASKAAAGAVTKGDDVTCLGCGHDLDDEDRYCSTCGKANPDYDGDDGSAAKRRDAEPGLEAHREPDGDEVGPDIDGDGDGHSASDANRDGIDDRLPQHAAKAAADGPVYHLRRLHDATCAAYHADDVIAAHPLAAKGLAALADPAPFAAMVTAALTEDAGTGSRAADLPGLSAAYHAAVAFKAAAAHEGLLDDAMADLRKAFTDYYPHAHPKPGDITPGQFHRPYVTSGRANQAAKPGQKPRVPLASHVPSPDDFNRPLITAGREAASPGSKPSGVGKARMYYTNQGKGQAATVLAAMHDWIADNHPTICPMQGAPYDNEPGVEVNSMGSTLTTAQPAPQRMGATKDHAVPVPVAAAHAASVVTPGPARKDKAAKAAKEERKMAKAAARAQEAAAAAATPAPLIDEDMLTRVLSAVVDARLEGVTKTIGELSDEFAAWKSEPDPRQMTPRAGAGAALGKARDASPEVPAGGDGPSEQRLMRLMKKTLDPDSGVRVDAIGELTEIVGREKAAELLAAAH
jgi:hypothetical protein